jgi:HEAT repeat protein
MKRLLTTVALLGLPIAASAQVPPVPPPAPVPPAPVAPTPLPPLPPLVPGVVVAPTIDAWAVEDAMRAAREAMFIDREAIRDAQEAARHAMEAARIEMADAAHLIGHDWEFQPRPFAFQTGDSSYSSGHSALQSNQYERAVTAFDRVIAQKGSRADAATFYKAFAQFRLGRTDDALATLTQLRQNFPQSRYLNDAKMLEADVRKSAGQTIDPAQAGLNDDIKLLAIQGLQNSDPERAVSALESVLSSTNSLRVKQRAIYILALNPQPRARQILLSYAKGGGNPDLQLEAIKYVAANRDRQTTSGDLKAIYESTQDQNVKLAIISAYRSSGAKTELVSIAGSTTAPVAVRSQAISGLTSIAAPQDLYSLYEKETNRDLRLQIISALGSMRAADQLNQVLRTEKDPEVRRRVISSLGRLKAETTGKTLVDMYGSEQDLDTRKAVISALSSQNNAEALVAIARKETNLDLKRDIVRRLSDMAPRSKVAADFLMEIIK